MNRKELTVEQIEKMSFEEIYAELGNRVYYAALILEQY